MKRQIFLAATLLAALNALAIAGRPVGATALDAEYATDAYPGFEPLEDKDPDFKERSWWHSVKRDTPEAQFEYARGFETNGLYSAAAKAYEALVREWPASPIAADAQLYKASVLARMDELDEAFDEYNYLLHYFPGLCSYAKVAGLQYQIACRLLQEDKSMFGLKFASNASKRLRFESVIRRAPGEAWVPDAMLTVGDLRVKDDELAEAVAVYGNVVTRFPKLPQAKEAAFKACKCRYTLVNRSAYNEHRCRNAMNSFKATLEKYPDLAEAELLKLWVQELVAKLEADAWERTQFYDSRQRTKQAAITAYERFLANYPESVHRAEAEARIEAIKGGAQPLKK